ncbi:MAG: hypothetical protein OXC62_00080, partial [Aestuariivita sp.]|nr:hypothetical protein [Aestuariivita sp.]
MGRVQISAQAEPVDGMCLDAKDRMNGAIRCAVFVTDQQSERKYRKTNDTQPSPHPEPGDDDPHSCP